MDPTVRWMSMFKSPFRNIVCVGFLLIMLLMCFLMSFMRFRSGMAYRGG